MVRLFRQLQLIKLFKQLEVRQRLKRALAAEEAAGSAADGAAAQQQNIAAVEAQVMAKYNSSQSRVGQRLSGEQPDMQRSTVLSENLHGSHVSSAAYQDLTEAATNASVVVE